MESTFIKKKEFKVGDTVKIISETKSNYHGKCIGKTGTVVIIPTEFTNIETDYIGVKIEGMSNPSSHHSCFYFRSSDLVIERNPELKMEFKVGDTVKIISESKFNYNGKCIGKTGEVVNVPPEYTNKKYDCIGVKIEGMPNPNSSHSWFYFKEADLVVVNYKVYPFFIDKLPPIEKPEFLNTKLNIKDEMHSEFTDNIFKKLIEQDMNNRKCTSYLRINSIERVLFNPPATIIFWKDGSKTVVKCRDDEEFDPEKGLAMAITKKALGNKRNYYETFWKFLPKEYKKKLKEKK